MEYLLALVAILFAILYAARKDGPLQAAIDKLLTSTSAEMGKAVNESVKRINF